MLAVNEIDLIGILLALAILFWIPTHTLTFSLKFREDYSQRGRADLPLHLRRCIHRATIAISSVLAALAIGWASILIGMSAGYLRLIAVLTAGLLLLPSRRSASNRSASISACSDTPRCTC